MPKRTLQGNYVMSSLGLNACKQMSPGSLDKSYLIALFRCRKQHAISTVAETG
jgi:hypothetical protein